MHSLATLGDEEINALKGAIATHEAAKRNRKGEPPVIPTREPPRTLQELLDRPELLEPPITNDGQGEIRTLDTGFTGMPVFETGAFNHSATCPPASQSIEARGVVQPGSIERCALKKSSISRAHSSASTPARTSGRWFSLGCRRRSPTEPAMPAFSSHAPNTTRFIRDKTIAPAHIAHGSTVT